MYTTLIIAILVSVGAGASVALNNDIGALLTSNTQATSTVSAVTTAGVDVALRAELKGAAEGRLTAAEHKLAEVKNFIAAKKLRVNGEVVAKAEVQLALAAQALAEGNTEFAAGLYSEAFVDFNSAIRLAQDAKLTIATAEKIKNENAASTTTAKVNKEGKVSVELEL